MTTGVKGEAANLRLSCAFDLKALRKDVGLTQAQLAQLLGMHKNYVSQVERGTYNISIDTYERFYLTLCAHPVETDSHRSLRIKVGEQLRALRRNRGCSQVQLGMFAGFSQLFMGRVERGEVATSMDQLEKICKLLKVDGRALLRQCVKD